MKKKFLLFTGQLMATMILLTACGGSVSKSEVQIGNQVWMTQNLDVDKFQNGDSIPEAKTPEEWMKAGEEGRPAWCYYDNNPNNENRFGKLYNWYAVNDSRGLAPEGWKIPSIDDWYSLIDFLGGKKVAGKKMKSTEFWADTDDGESCNGTNESGFNGLPGGYRKDNGLFYGFFKVYGNKGYWWDSSDFISNGVWIHRLDYDDCSIDIYADYNKGYGFSVRCLRN